MKKRKIFYLFPIVSILLTGCTFQEGWDSVKTWFNDKVLSIFNKNSGGSSKDGGGSDIAPGDVTPEDTKTHATSISYTSGYPSAPFYLKLGQTQRLSVSLSPSKDVDESEKLFKWELEGDNVTCDLTTDSNKIDVTGAKVGKCTMKVTNTYNASLYKTYTIKVIDFNDSMDYLWQYSSSDRAQFGYDSTSAKQGTAEGNANLGGMTWHYTRQDKDGNDLTTSLQSSMSSVGFGKGTEPETHLHFEAENAREVSKITIEAGSAHGLAKMSVKVGDTVYMNEETVPYPSWDVVPTMPDMTGSSTGKIVIDVVTPEYDATQIEDPTYKAPGAFYLKSIWINFNDTIPDKTLTLVKSASDFTAGSRYLLVGKPANFDSYLALDGTLSTSVAANPLQLTDFEFGDSVSVSGTMDKYGYILSFDENDKLLFTADNGIHIGMADGGGLSVTKSPARQGWSYSVSSDGKADLTMVDKTDKTRHLGVSDDGKKFDCYASAKDIYFFKFN